MALLASGSLGGVFIEESYHLGMRGIIPILGLLHHAIPEIPWLGCLMFTSWIFIQSSVIYFSAITFLPSKSQNIFGVTAMWFTLQLLVFGFSFIEFSITGMGLLLTFTAGCTLFQVSQNKLTITEYLFWIMLSGIALYIGYGMRLESGIGGTILSGVYIVCAKREPLVWVKSLWLPILVSFIALFSYQDAVKKSFFFDKVEPLIFYVTDSKNKPEFAAKDEVDKAINEMARSSCLIDSSVVNYELFSRLAQEKRKYESGILFSPVRIACQVRNVISPTIANNKTITCLAAIILLCGLFISFSCIDKNLFKSLILFNSALIMIILFLSYSMKMEQWHYIPLLQILILGNLLLSGNMWYAYMEGSPITRMVSYGIFVSMILFYLSENIRNHQSINEKVALQKEIERENQNNFIFYDVGTRELLDNFVFRIYQPKNNVYFYDLAQLVYLKEYSNRLNELCSCNSFSPVEFFDFLRHSNNEIYISTEQRSRILKDFINSVHHMNINFGELKQYELSNTAHTQSVTKCIVYAVN